MFFVSFIFYTKRANLRNKNGRKKRGFICFCSLWKVHGVFTLYRLSYIVVSEWSRKFRLWGERPTGRSQASYRGQKNVLYTQQFSHKNVLHRKHFYPKYALQTQHIAVIRHRCVSLRLGCVCQGRGDEAMRLVANNKKRCASVEAHLFCWGLSIVISLSF